MKVLNSKYLGYTVVAGTKLNIDKLRLKSGLKILSYDIKYYLFSSSRLELLTTY